MQSKSPAEPGPGRVKVNYLFNARSRGSRTFRLVFQFRIFLPQRFRLVLQLLNDLYLLIFDIAWRVNHIVRFVPSMLRRRRENSRMLCRDRGLNLKIFWRDNFAKFLLDGLLRFKNCETINFHTTVCGTQRYRSHWFHEIGITDWLVGKSPDSSNC